MVLSALIISAGAALASQAAAGPCQSPTDPFLNPFNRASAFHRPIGTGATYAGDQHPTTQALRRRGFSNINSDNGWGTNLYRSTAADRYMTVTHAGPYDQGLPVSLRVPASANNGTKSDSVVVIFDESTRSTHQFYQWRWNNGRPTAAIHREWDIRGLGHTGPGGGRVGTSASGVAGMFGLLRGHEVNVPGYKIQHALQMSLDARGLCGMMMKKEVVWPASGTDGFCDRDPSACRGQIPYGALLAVPPTVNTDRLGLSEAGSRLAEALKHYGVYVIDNSECPAMRADQNVNGTVRQALIRDMRKIYPYLRMILNNSPRDSVAGGGVGRAPNCAFDAPGR